MRAYGMQTSRLELVITFRLLFDYHKSLWHAGWKYPIILWQKKLPCSKLVWKQWYEATTGRWPRTRDHSSISTMYISTSWTRCPPRSCKYIQAFTSLGEYDTRRVSNEKRLPKIMAKESLMLHLQRVSCTAYHWYRREYIKITESLPE